MRTHPDYSEAVWQYFSNDSRAGRLPEAQFSVRVRTPGSRAEMLLEACIADGQIEDTRFQVYGCVSAIACGAWLAEWMMGRTLQELAALDAPAIEAALELAPVKRHCALLAEDALRMICEQWRLTATSTLKATG